MHNRDEVVKRAREFLGAKKGDSTHKRIINTYNSIPNHKGCMMSYNAPWCAAFVSVISYLTDNLDIMFEETSCNNMIKRYQAVERWKEEDNYIPLPGDVIFYDWDDNGIGDCTGIVEHVGIVESCDGNSIKIIEGNMGNDSIVGRRHLKVNARYIRGFAVPNYDHNYYDDEPMTAYTQYTVVKGDTLSGIAVKLRNEGINITWQKLAKDNNINAPYIIYPGQKLEVIP